DENGERMLPDAPDEKVEAVFARFRSWGAWLEQVDEALGPGLPDTLAAGTIEQLGGAAFPVHYRRRHPGVTLKLGKDSALVGAEWTDRSRALPHGLRVGMTRHQLLVKLGLPWSSRNDPFGMGRIRESSGHEEWKGRDDSATTWLYVVEGATLEFDYLVFS